MAVIAAIYELLGSIDVTLYNASAMVISGLAGLVMLWFSRRSVNHKKIDPKVVLECFLFFIYFNALFLIVMQIGTIIAYTIYESTESFIILIPVYTGTAIINILIFWGLLLRTKKMKIMMGRIKDISKRLFYLINAFSMLIIIFNYSHIPFVIADREHIILDVINILNWIVTIFWISLMIVYIWKSATFIYNEMRITLIDGEVINYSCRPQMCRIHRNYIRLLKRDDNGKTVYERHINERVVKQIEYLSES